MEKEEIEKLVDKKINESPTAKRLDSFASAARVTAAMLSLLGIALSLGFEVGKR